MAYGKHHPISHMIDGFLVAFSGTNKEKIKKGISLIIAVLLLYVLIWFGLNCVGYHGRWEAFYSWEVLIARMMGGVLGLVLGIAILLFAGSGALIYIFTMLLLVIGSLIGLIKKNASEGSRVAAFLVSLIGFIIVIAVPVAFICA